MRIAYVTGYDPRDNNNWSGLGYFIWKCLAARGIEVELIGPLPLPAVYRKWSMCKWRFYHHLQGRYYYSDADLTNVCLRSLAAGRKLESLPPVDAIVSATILPAAFLPGKVPLVIYSDATLRSLYRTYEVYSNLSPLNLRHADRIERAAQSRAAALVYASEWAANSVRTEYGVDPAKVHVVPFGANLESFPTRLAVEQAIDARDRQKIRLLFIGMDWDRKGGPAALAVVRELNRTGFQATLTLIGCGPRLEEADRKFVEPLGFIEKNEAGLVKIQAELLRSHFLIVPSLAECFGIVYCEASAFGVPSIARKVGGVASAVSDGRNGKLFEPGDSPAQIATWIAGIFGDMEAYRRLARSSRTEFEERLNWNTSGEKLERILREVIAKK
ncbi:MAG TPA: glycosyltransferase family 4 protein [Verrucomicrobiae bacterium]|nr:glycosyltransferase family 4 protein [Verrucomicrobiae bacterium]